MSIPFKPWCYAVSCLLLAACASPRAPSALPASTAGASPGAFGAVTRTAFARQVIGLPSGAPVTGIDSAAALQAQRKYSKSFAEHEQGFQPLVPGAGAQK